MRRRAMVLVLFVVCVCLLTLTAAAQATTIEVTTTADLAVSSCPGPECSLREAVAVSQEGEVIKLAGSSAGPDEYKLTQGRQIVVSTSLTITGDGTDASIIDGSANMNNRIMKVAGGIVRIEGVKFTRGFDGADEGLEGCSPCETLRANGGGALYNAAALELENVIFEGDGVSSGDPTGGAIGNAGTLDLRNVSFPGDNAAIGGALFSRGGQINAEDVTFENDGASAFDGGAVFLFSGGNASFINTTVVGGGWSSSFGGGIDNSGSTLTLTNDTLSGNIRGALETDTGGNTTVQNTILGSGFSDNADFDCVGEGKGTNVNTTTAKAITTDLGNNIDQDGVCGLNVSGDESKVDPKLAPIADNGGLTPTQALLHGSPAIDAGNDSACPATDARGIARPQGAHCDVGAFEAVLHGPPVVATVAATGVAATEATLRATVELAGEAGSYHFLWGTSPSELTNETPEVGAGVIGAGTVESEKLPGLSVEETYYFQAVADNASGSATAGNLMSFTTASETAGGPVIANVTVASRTETTATIEFTIDPNGAETSYVISYGPSSAYGQQTEPVSIGSTPGSKRLQRVLTGLEPHRTYHFRVLATNFKGTVSSEDQQFATEVPAATTASASSPGPVPHVPGPLPPPVLGKTVNVELVSGKVLIALPPTAQASALGALRADLSSPLGALESVSKGLKFIPLTEARQIPVGSTLDTTEGVVSITTATSASLKGKLQFGDFGAGIFKLLQDRKQQGLTQLNLIDRLSRRTVCASVGKSRRASVAKHLSSKVLGQLNSTDHGKFTARGQYSAATVRGTEYSVEDTCAGTLTRVTRGVVAVRDFRKRKTITLRSGKSYLAKAPR